MVPTERFPTDPIMCSQGGIPYNKPHLDYWQARALEAERQLSLRSSSVRQQALEEAAKVAEAEAQKFLSPQYAANQPLGSLLERFACEEVAKAIRALAQEKPT